MNDEEFAFIRAIIAEPRNDLPRLVYADWLEERGRGSKADFIRVQCQLARMREWDRQRADGLALRVRQYDPDVRKLEELLPEWGHWIHHDIGQEGIWYAAGVEPGFEVCLQRGFIEQVRCSYEMWILQHGPELCKFHPVEHVIVTNKEPLAVGAMPPIRPGGVSAPERYWTWQIATHDMRIITTRSEIHHGVRTLMKNAQFPTFGMAEVALSDAMIQWARFQAAVLGE